jgi:hypothetical protein
MGGWVGRRDGLDGVTFQKTVLFTVTTVRTSNITDSIIPAPFDVLTAVTRM